MNIKIVIKLINRGYISRYVDNDFPTSAMKKGRNFGYGSKLLEKNYHPIEQKQKKKKKNLNKINIKNLMKEQMAKVSEKVEEKANLMLAG